MSRRSTWILVLFLILGAVAQAFAQDTVKLEYKFTPNELLRYKMIMNMTMSMNIPGMEANGAQMPTIPMQMIGIMRQRTKKILPNGDAEMAFAIESMKMVMQDQTQELPTDKMPVMTMVISKNGVMKSFTAQGGANHMSNMMGGMEMMNPSAFGQYSGMPQGEMKVGDTWEQEIPFPMGEGKIQVTGKLLGVNEKLGSRNVAVFTQDFGGDIDLNMPVAVDPNNGVPSANVDAKGKFLGDGKVFFSTEMGQMVRTEGKTTMQMSMNVGGGPAGQAGAAGANMAMDMIMDMTFEVFLLPPTEEK